MLLEDNLPSSCEYFHESSKSVKILPFGRFFGVISGTKIQLEDPGISIKCTYMGVSENSGFSPQIIHFNRLFHYFHHPFWGAPIFGTKRLVVGCGFCTFGDPLNLQVVRIVCNPELTASLSWVIAMHLRHVLLSHLCISLPHQQELFEKKCNKTKKTKKTKKNNVSRTSLISGLVAKSLIFLFFLVFSSSCYFWSKTQKTSRKPNKTIKPKKPKIWQLV